MNGKYYIGSGIKLNNRINDYFQASYYRDKSNLTIVKAILKYGMDNFALLILKFNEEDNLLSRDWLDKLKPEYNILTEAGNYKGFQHSK